jgi:8-oxo-dGTP pyrophosphatase MutT (NUDIX family)
MRSSSPDPRKEVSMSWHLTVAAIVERGGRFLIVEETDRVNPELVLNQPAGHVDPGEAILDAVVRETLEETALTFTPESLVGVYQLRARNGRDYCRICFAGSVPEGDVARPGEGEIVACHWLTRDEIAAGRTRSSVVLRCIDDYLAGRRLPLAAVRHYHVDRPLGEPG